MAVSDELQKQNGGFKRGRSNEDKDLEAEQDPRLLEDYRSIQETLYLYSLPWMKEKIIQGIEAPLDDCVECSDD